MLKHTINIHLTREWFPVLRHYIAAPTTLDE